MFDENFVANHIEFPLLNIKRTEKNVTNLKNFRASGANYVLKYKKTTKNSCLRCSFHFSSVLGILSTIFYFYFLVPGR